MKRLKENLKLLMTRAHQAFLNLVHPVKAFEVYFVEYLQYSYEDPKCPYAWKGSGCYDIEIYANSKYKLTVCARNEKEASDYTIQEYMKADGDYEILGILKSKEPVPAQAFPGYEVNFIQKRAKESDWSGKEERPTLETLVFSLASL